MTLSPAPAPVPPRHAEATVPLRLEADCRVLPGDGALHVITRRGTFDVKGRDAYPLHCKLLPFLQGTHSEADLLAAIPPRLVQGVKSYLDRLRLMGALGDGLPPEPDPSEQEALHALGAARPEVSFKIGDLPVHVSLAGYSAGPHGCLDLCFVTPGEAADLLLRNRRAGRLTCVLVDTAPAAIADFEMERRAGFARWLLCHELGVSSNRPRLQLFRLDSPGGVLERVVVAEAPDGSDLSTIPDQLGLVHALEGVDQLPLVVAEASHEIFPCSVVGCGLDFPKLREQLLGIFLARVSTRPDEAERVGFLSGVVGDHPRTYLPVRVPFERTTHTGVSSSLAALQLGLLEELADATRATVDTRWKEVDLLDSTGSEHPVVTYLQDVLRLRRSGLAARLGRTRDGLFICEAGEHRARSYLRAKAIAEVLLGVVWDEFYAGTSSQRAAPLARFDHAEFAPMKQIRRRVRDAAKALATDGEPIRIVVRRLSRWGTRVWVGTFEPPQADFRR